MTLPPAYFDSLYAKSADPWSLSSRWYERRKYDVTLASLPKPRFRNGFEPGCSVGVLSQGLAARCDQLLATDVSAVAVATTRERLRDCPNVTVEQSSVPTQWPKGEFDLIVLSEIGYYLVRSDLEVLVDRTVASLSADGVVAAVHWRHPVADYPLTGDTVHEIIGTRVGLQSLVSHVEPDFRLDVFARPATRSVAAAEGLTP